MNYVFFIVIVVSFFLFINFIIVLKVKSNYQTEGLLPSASHRVLYTSLSYSEDIYLNTKITIG